MHYRFDDDIVILILEKHLKDASLDAILGFRWVFSNLTPILYLSLVKFVFYFSSNWELAPSQFL